MRVYVVVRESSSNNSKTSSQVLGVFPNEELAVECINNAYEVFMTTQEKDDTLVQHCYISEEYLFISTADTIDKVKMKSIESCPDKDAFYHMTDESIYCMGYLDGHESRLAGHLD